MYLLFFYLVTRKTKGAQQLQELEAKCGSSKYIYFIELQSVRSSSYYCILAALPSTCIMVCIFNIKYLFLLSTCAIIIDHTTERMDVLSHCNDIAVAMIKGTNVEFC